jgi:hypothetical protein
MSEQNTEPNIKIGLREIYDAVVELKGIVSGHPDKLDDHEARIRSLEIKVWSFSGIAAAIATIVTQILSTIK